MKSAYKTEGDLKWMQVQSCLKTSFDNACKEKPFETMSNLQEAEIILRSIITLNEIEAKRNG